MITRRNFTAFSAAGLLIPSLGYAQDTAMYDAQMALVFGQRAQYDHALDAISKRGNLDMVAGLILGLRYTRQPATSITKVLRQLTGHMADQVWSQWSDWMLWQEAHPEVVPHTSFPDFKRQVFISIGPEFSDFLKPEFITPQAAKIRLEEIAWGGVRKDGIPSLDTPELVGGADKKAAYLKDSDLVFGVSINGDTRAYPLRIMGWHEMLNATIGGVPVALAYCTLCGSGILFETQVEGRGQPLVFGSSGFLYRSNKLMFDRQTDTLWNQFTGKPVVGALAGSEITLKQRPVVITTWKDWLANNPDTKVVTLKTGHRRNYGSGVVYAKYFASPDLMFPTVVDQSEHRQKDYVFGVRAFGGAKAYPLAVFKAEPIINDQVGNQEIVLIGDAATRTVRAYERSGHSFARNENGDLVTQDNRLWAQSEDELRSDDDDRLARVAGHISYWFAWNGYLGDTGQVYGAK